MRKQTKKIVLLGVVILLISISGYFFPQQKSVFKKPALRKNASDYLTGAELLNLRESIQYYQHKIRIEPEAIANYTNLATLKMQQARLMGSHHENYAEVQQLLNKILSSQPQNFEAVLTQASLHMNYHKFEEAKVWAEKAISINAFNALAWGVYSDAFKELGEYDAAVEACDKMLSIRPDLRSYARAAHLRELHGDIPGAKAAMKLAVNAGVIGLESHAWALYQLGNLYLTEGKLDSAEYLYEAILETNPKYGPAYKGLGEVALERGNSGRALNSLHKAYEFSPQHEFAETLVKVYRLSGDDKKAEKLIQFVLKQFKEHEKQGWNIDLEYAKFCLENEVNLEEALRRISKEFKRRPNQKKVAAVYRIAFAKTSNS